MARLTKTEAVARLAEGGAVIAVDEQGDEFELRPKRADGTVLTALTDRLRLVSARQALVRVHDDDGRPWIVTLRVESAQMRGAERAETVLRAVGLRLDPAHRQADRVAINGQAWLTAVNCQNVVDRDVVEARIVDLAEGGVAVVTRRILRPGDRLLLRARFFATQFEAEVRVARTREQGGMIEAGCQFIGITGEQRRTLHQLIGYRDPANSVSVRSLLHGIGSDEPAATEPPSLWRRLLRKTA